MLIYDHIMHYLIATYLSFNSRIFFISVNYILCYSILHGKMSSE